jgi:hypothetical protein
MCEFCSANGNEVAATNKRTEARTYLMDAESVAYLLAPCILFAWMACWAVMDGTDYAAMPQAEHVVERQRKDAELRKIVVANIAAGNPIPDRETMLEELDARDERVIEFRGHTSRLRRHATSFSSCLSN